MNIAQAKEEIRRALLVYLHKDEQGMYTYPVSQQRPILLMGPPGIGKSAVIAQVARSSGVGLVSYTMTHHTRQSAIGLPHVVERAYAGRSMTLTEYTMSEIVASIYQCMDKTGLREGILFIDEINSVSETLSPVMLQLLQNKQFGMHSIPEGWIIVAAGNPSAYNRSAKEFDLVTLDRVRLMEIEPDLAAWKRYALSQGVHPAVLAYLEIHPDHFYEAESRVGEKCYVTARGWEDLSRLLLSYEALDLPVREDQAEQFLGDRRIAGSFASFYRIFVKNGQDYEITRMLSGSLSPQEYEDRLQMAQSAPLGERLSLIGQLLCALQVTLTCEHEAREKSRQLAEKQDQALDCFLRGETLETLIDALQERLQVQSAQDILTQEQTAFQKGVICQLEKVQEELALQHQPTGEAAWEAFRAKQEEMKAAAEERGREAEGQLGRAFSFCEKAFTQDTESAPQEMLMLVTSLSGNPLAMEHIQKEKSEMFLDWCDRLGLGT